MKRVVIFGSTGQIGQSALSVIKESPDLFRVAGLYAHSNEALLKQQSAECGGALTGLLEKGNAAFCGVVGMPEMLDQALPDIVIFAFLKSVSLAALLLSLKMGVRCLLANKELLVSAGKLIMETAERYHNPVIPIDHEHGAIFQCLLGEKQAAVREVILTASGGPFLYTDAKDLEEITPELAYRHPHLQMGKRVAVNCSTLMNKGLEMIEAQRLFGLLPGQIKAVIHPESIVQSLVTFEDGFTKAVLAPHSLAHPLRYALHFPHRASSMPGLDFSPGMKLQFFPPDLQKFRCLALAQHAMHLGESAPCFLSSANEVLVDRFCRGELKWLAIGEKLEGLLQKHTLSKLDTLESIFETERMGAESARKE